MGAINWTKEQLEVIDSINCNTLVSASAGSGKTAVMLERVLRIITGESGENKTPLKRIIMVTFNESVSSELKSKIAAGLAKRLAGSDDRDYLIEQIEDVPLADISTMHSLCSTIIKSNFEYLGIQPSYSIVDENEKQVLFGKAVESVMKEYRESYDYEIDILVNYLGGENRFCATLSKIYSFLEAQLDRDKYLDELAYSCYDGDFKNSLIAKRYLAELHIQIFDFLHKAEDFQMIFESRGLNKHRDNISAIKVYLKTLSDTKDIAEFANSIRFAPAFERIPNLSKEQKDDNQEHHDNYKKYKSQVSDWIKDLKNIFPMPFEEIQAQIDGAKPYLTRLIDIMKRVASEYSAIKIKDNKMDFADLEYYAVKAMQNDAIADELSSNYDYICVDEYQDINAVQDYILSRLSNGKNLFMVGDIKQSIYQFRMTDPKIFLDKYRLYKQKPQLGNSFSLNCNYRSSKEVVDFVNAIFDVIMKEDMGGIDYKKESRLLQGNLDYELQSDMPIRIAHFAKDTKQLKMPIPEDGVYSVKEDAQESAMSSSREGKYIARQILSLVGKRQIQVSSGGTMSYRTVRYGDIALLCSARNQYVDSIVSQLKSAGIPVDSGKISQEKNNTCVSLFISFIRVIDNYRQDIPLAEILTSKVFANFNYKDLAKIKTTYRKVDFFHEAVVQYAKEQSDELAMSLKEFFQMLDTYRRLSSFMGVDELLLKAVADFNYRAYMSAIDGGISQLAGFDSFIRSLDGKTYNASLSKFIQAVDETVDFGKVLGEVGNEGDCVVTNTIHSSKGLEYPIVFIIDAGRRLSFADLNKSSAIFDKTYGVALKSVEEQDRFYDDSLPFTLMRRLKSKELLEERMRLFYVATTRARNMLYITATGGLSSSKKEENKKAFGEELVKSPLSFIDWLNNVALENPSFLDKYFDKDAEQIDDGQIEQVQNASKRKLVDIDYANAFAQSLASNYDHMPSTTLLVKHTVTAVNNDYYNSLYGDNFKYDDNALDAIKDGDFSDEEVQLKRNSADEGVAYHRVLECIEYNCFTVDDVKDQLDDMVEQGLLSDGQRQLVDPESILECLESDVMQQARMHPHYREKQFMLNLPANEFLNIDSSDKVLLQGTVDLFIQGGSNGGENILVDFKYSHKSKEQIKKRYQKQIDLYAMAIEECLNIKVDKRVIIVLGRNEVIEM